MSQIFQRHFHDAWVQIPAENEANERIAVHRKASLARKKPGRCQSVNERARSVGVPKPSLSALQQRNCRQGLNLQEVYRVLTSRRMSLLGELSLLSRTVAEQRKYDSRRARVLFCQSR